MKDIEFKVKLLPEEKRGYWEASEFKLSTGSSWAVYKCSCCGMFTVRDWNYCPNCGAKMEMAKIEQPDVEAED